MVTQGKELQQFKEEAVRKLLAEKRRFQDQVDRNNGKRTEEPINAMIGSNHIADVCLCDLTDTDISQHQTQKLQKCIHRINASIRKINQGNYGVCDECEGLISINRLRALPFASLCIVCQTEKEEKKKHKKNNDHRCYF